ncbi:MFS transporter [Woodsholea maritima]|uniref:MFS transporter n=1 Tax=Woodsholea maritima TaxID=240237 RepID=UPI00035CA22C|nr:MFS transporter [Woodsholea maritima]
MTTDRHALSQANIVGYASGNFGKNILWNTLEIFLIFYLTDILGVNPAKAGLIVLLSVIWDALLDPLVAVSADKTQSRWGKYGPYIMIGAPLASLSFMAIFLMGHWGLSMPFFVVVAMIMVFRMAYTIIDLPHNALIARVTRDGHVRSRIAITRFMFSATGSFTLSIASIAIFSAPTPQGQAENFLIFAYIAALLSLGAMWVSWFSVRRFDIEGPAGQINLVDIPRALGVVLRHRNGLIVLSLAFISGMSLPIFGRMLSYYSKYYLDDFNYQWAVWPSMIDLDVVISTQNCVGYALAALMMGQFLFSFVLLRGAKYLTKAQILRLSHGIIVMAMIIFAVWPPHRLWGLVSIAFIVGLGSAGIWSVIWGMAPDIVDQIESQYGFRPEGMFIGCTIVFMKLANGLGNGLMGASLDALGYVANAVQSPLTLKGLHIISWGWPILGSVACIGLLQIYREGR